MGAYRSAPDRKKKAVDEALATLANENRMVGPLFDVAVAAHINRLHGGAVIAAWQVEALDEGTAYLYTQHMLTLPTMRAGVAKIEARKAELRARARR